jgi:hypothetical protein
MLISFSNEIPGISTTKSGFGGNRYGTFYHKNSGFVYKKPLKSQNLQVGKNRLAEGGAGGRRPSLLTN